MSTPKRIFTLNVGSQTVSLAEFRPGRKRDTLRLHAFETRDLMADPAADATRSSQASLLLGEMVDALKAKNQPVRLSLPAQLTFSRMVKVPAMSGSDLPQMVMFEAKQNIPYPLEEVVWDYRVVFETESHDSEVLIVAAKADLLDEWTAVVDGAKMNPGAIEMSGVALLNAFRYNYGEPEGCSLIIDLGARTTNLIFVEEGKFFIRAISSGGSALTAAVAKEFGENFSVAEIRKTSGGYIAQGASFAESENPDEAKLSKVLRNAATRLHAEITRSISFYRSQQAGAAPQRVYLCGGGTRMGLVTEFWQEKLGLPVELFNPLRCIGLTDRKGAGTLTESTALLGEHVGLALQTALKCPVAINLLPPAIRKKSYLNQIALAIGLSAACVCAPLLAWGFHLQRSAEIAAGLTEKLIPEISRAQKTDRDIKAVLEEIQSTKKAAAPMEIVASERRYWVTMIEQIHACLPAQLVWCTSFEMIDPEPPKPGANDKTQPVPRLMIRGLYLENPDGVQVVDRFGKELQRVSKLTTEYQATRSKLLLAEAAMEKKEIDQSRGAHDKVCKQIQEGNLPFPPVAFEVAPVEDWVRTNKPNPTEYAQDFAIPLIPKTPPAKTAMLTP
ncbi:MAG: pilus assembly protein PilM [Verrucomicrobiota bacterium]